MPEYPDAGHRRDHADRHATNGPDQLAPGDIGAASTAALTAHEADTTAIHGITDTAALVVDGDTAGGVLAGTYPNPGFAVDMATQAELDAVAAAKHNTITGAWATYVPALTAVTTSPTLGASSRQYGHYLQIGRLVVATAFIKFGTSGAAAGSGDYRVSLPVTARTIDTDERGVFGHGLIDDAGTAPYQVEAQYVTTTTVQLRFAESTAAPRIISNSVPFTWTNLDEISLNLMYEAASG